MITPATLTNEQVLDACYDGVCSFRDAWDSLGAPVNLGARQRVCDAINAAARIEDALTKLGSDAEPEAGWELGVMERIK